jgi:hypothetical protein
MAKHKKHTKSNRGNRLKGDEMETFLKVINPLWCVIESDREWLLELAVSTPIDGKYYLTEAVFKCISGIIAGNRSSEFDFSSLLMLARELDRLTYTILIAAVKVMLAQVCTGKHASELGLVCFNVEHSESDTLPGFQADFTLLNDDFSGNIIIRLQD